jgi:hypothetical protein
MFKPFAPELHRGLFEKSKKILGNVWESLNDPNFAPPYGQYLLGKSPEQLVESFGTDTKKILRLATLAIAILNTASSEALANKEKPSVNPNEIVWALEALNGIDPINYVLNQKETNGARSPEDKLSFSEVNTIAWNLYFESRGENEEGQKAVMLTTLNRMLSTSYPKSAEGVVYGKYQHAWTLEIEKLKSQKVDMKSFLKIRAMVERILESGNHEVKKSQEVILKELASSNKIDWKILESMQTFNFHKRGMVDPHNPHLNRYLKDIKSFDTLKRLIFIEQLADSKSNRVVSFGTHVFYGNVNNDELNKMEVTEAYQKTVATWKSIHRRN